MKREIIFILLILVVFLFIMGFLKFTGKTISEEKLISYYEFEGNAKDSMGASNGVIVGDAEFVEGKIGQAITLSWNSYISLGNVLSNQDIYGGESGTSTIIAWVKPTDVDRYNVLAKNIGGLNYLSIGKEPKGYRKRIVALIYNKATRDDFWAESTKLLESNKWTQIAFVLEGEKGYKIYIDGELNTAHSNSYLVLENYGAESSIGKGFDENSYFEGAIDDLRIYKGILSAGKIKELYDMGA